MPTHGVTDNVDHAEQNVSRATEERRPTEADRYAKDLCERAAHCLGSYLSKPLGFLSVFYYEDAPGKYTVIPLLSHDNIPYGLVGEGMKALAKKTLEAFKREIANEADHA